MPHEAVFRKAVEKFLPSAIPASLEKIDEYVPGKILVYSKKPRKLIPMRRHELDFTGYSVESLLAENEELRITTARSFLFDTGKSSLSTVVKVDGGEDLGLENSLTKLVSTDLSLKLKAGEEKTLTITSDFGKITHITTDIVNSGRKGIQLDPEHPVVKRAVDHGGVMFIVSAIYEAERCHLTMKMTKDESESGGISADAGPVKGEVSEGMEDKHLSTGGTVLR